MYGSHSAPRVPATLPGVCSTTVYTIGNHISSGSFATVYRASCFPSGPDVAVKFVAVTSQAGDSNYLDAIKNEVSILNRLTHPHVVRVHDYVEHPHFRNPDGTTGAIGLVMDLAKCTLKGYISRRANMEEASARWLFQQLMLAVDHCHGKNVTQRDIKPGNILMFPQTVNGSKTVVLKLADFGWAKRFDLSTANTRAGTIVYAAPEVLRAHAHLPRHMRRYEATKADVWSCGVVLFEMLFPSSFREQVEEHPTGLAPQPTWAVPPPIASGRSLECTQLLQAMLHPDPLLRASVSDVLAHPWFQEDLPPGTLEMNEAALMEPEYFPEEALQSWLDGTLERYA